MNAQDLISQVVDGADPNSLNEAGNELDPSLVKTISQMTNDNDHTGAMIVLAKAMGKREFEAIFKYLEKANDDLNRINNGPSAFFNVMGGAISKAKIEASRILWKEAESKYSNGKEITSAF